MQHFIQKRPQRLRHTKIFFCFLSQLDCKNTKVAWKHLHDDVLFKNAACSVHFHKPLPDYIYLCSYLCQYINWYIFNRQTFYLPAVLPPHSYIFPTDEAVNILQEINIQTACNIPLCNTAPLRQSKIIFQSQHNHHFFPCISTCISNDIFQWKRKQKGSSVFLHLYQHFLLQPSTNCFLLFEKGAGQL